MTRYVIVSESRGVFCGNHQWSNDEHVPDKKNIRYPAWTEKRAERMMADVVEYSGLTDLRIVGVQGKEGAPTVTFNALVQAGRISRFVVNA